MTYIPKEMQHEREDADGKYYTYDKEGDRQGTRMAEDGKYYTYDKFQEFYSDGVDMEWAIAGLRMSTERRKCLCGHNHTFKELEQVLPWDQSGLALWVGEGQTIRVKLIWLCKEECYLHADCRDMTDEEETMKQWIEKIACKTPLPDDE